VAAVTVYSAPDDGRKGRPKHVKRIVVVNKHNNARVASCWFIIYYRLVMDGNSNMKCRAYLWLLINTILPELHLVGLLYIIDL